MIEIDGPKALELLQQAVDEKGADYVYTKPAGGTCVYVKDDAPSCLVADALHRVGVSVDTLRAMDAGDWDDGDGDTSIGPVCDVSDELFGFAVDGVAREVLATAQAAQDSGAPWGFALELAQEEAERLRTP